MKYALLTLLLVAFNASATKTNEGCQGNCPSTGGGSNEANNHANSSSDSSSSAGAVGVGVGVGLGGQGGDGGAGGSGGSAVANGNGYGGSAVGLGGSGGDSSSAVKDSGNSANFNSNTAKGGDASQGQLQGQQQGQGQHQSSTSVSGSKSIAQQALENSNKINASSANDNRSSAAGNTTVTNVGGDSTLVERNVAPIYMGPLTPTNCGGSVGVGGGDRNGNGLISWTWTGEECKIRMLGDRFQALGQVDIACELYSSTKAFKKAAKRNPKLASIDCKAKPAPVAAPVLVAPELAPRLPRG